MSVLVTQTIAETREFLKSIRREGKSIGLVPTMGALHAGHARLIETARRACDVTVVSIFVNPLQFGPQEDYQRYPRVLDADVELCANLGVALVFSPAVAEMYRDPITEVDLPGLTDTLCGPFRPGHFKGVATVVLKLLNIVQPDRAYFGEKDMQQLALIRQMVQDLNVPVEIIGVPTVREADGLALSSRNRYLDPSQRQIALVLYRALLEARERIRGGEHNAPSIRNAATALIRREPGVRVDYFEIVDDRMQPVLWIAGPVHAAGAIWLGSTRLIDNILCP